MDILLVEDHPALADLLSRAIEAEGHHVELAAGHGPARRRLGRSPPPDLVVVDCGVADADLAALLRASGRPSLCLATGRREAPGAPAPAGLDRLAERLVELRGAVTLGPLRVEPRDGRATWAGVDLGLGGKPLALLLALARARGAPVPRDRLLEEVWGLHFDPGTNVVEATTYRLRRQLREAGVPLRVRSVRGRGYALPVGAEG